MRRALLSLVAAVLLLLALGTASCAELMNDGGVLKYYDENGRQAVKIGLDLSQFNNQVDFQALKEQGFDFVLVRLGGRGWGSGGLLYSDRQTQAYLRGAREAGMEVGGYFYSTAINAKEAVEEAASCIRKLDGFRLDLPVFLDMEYSGDYPNGRADVLSPGARADIISTFCTAIDASGYRSGLYASEGYLRFDLDSEAVYYLPLWMASYTVDNRLPQYIRNYEIWQANDSTVAGGADGAFDLNIILP